MPVTIQEPQQDSRISIRAFLRALLVDPAENATLQFFRYTMVGGVALAADFSALFVLTHFAGLHYLVSAAVGFLVGLAVNYILSSLWVFARHTLQNRAVEFAIFAAIGVAGLGLNELGMWLLAGVAGLYYLWAKLITAAAVYFWNFGARKVALFR